VTVALLRSVPVRLTGCGAFEAMRLPVLYRPSVDAEQNAGRRAPSRQRLRVSIGGQILRGTSSTGSYFSLRAARCGNTDSRDARSKNGDIGKWTREASASRYLARMG
jgi:hypothetical protein